MKHRLNTVLVVFASLFLSACAIEHPHRSGPSIDIYPIEHRYAVVLEKEEMEKARDSLQAFIDIKHDVLINNSLKVTYSSSLGHNLANYAESYLQSKGVDSKQITLMNSKEREYFDFILVIDEYRVTVNDCEKSTVASYFSSSNGCYTEGARWLSIQNPERMLSKEPHSSSFSIKE